jgi:EpsD family peptidyl-prolyl cis-trans isomerase
MPTRMQTRLSRSLAVIILAGMSVGCSKKAAEGQVVAVVDGEEVTRRDLAGEPGATAMSDGDAARSSLGVVLQGVVDRKLAAAEAQRLALDRTPQYVAQAKRLDEVMLSRTLFDRWAAEMPEPDKRAIARFVAANPQRFDGRKLFLVDRIETVMGQGQSAALAPLQSNDAIAAYLDSRSQSYRRERVVLDSSTLPLALYRRLLAQAPGNPLAIGKGDNLVALAVIEARDAPLNAAEGAAEAVKAIKQQAVQSKLATLRKSADITYQAGYRPQTGKSE